MNTLTARSSRPSLRAVLMIKVTVGAMCILFAIAELARAQTRSVEPGLIAHEWGTFTSIAGGDGQALQWLPLTPSGESPGFIHRDLLPIAGLPGFVYHAQVGLKFNLEGTIRMETPVLYFYSHRDLTLSVRVAFAKGLITEWYPKASQVTPTETARSDFLYKKQGDGIIAWDAVTLEPAKGGDLPREATDSRYYAARNTASTPLRVCTDVGEEHEKFLFYRGVSAAPVPISARFSEDGKLLIKSTSQEPIPNIILFERRGGRLGFRVIDTSQTETPFETPGLTSSIDALAFELEEMLVARGLYRDEAHAMLQTWGDSWFEEGSRLIYILPVSYVDAILPLSINPIPAQTLRVLVGRVELISPATQNEVKSALVSRDRETVGSYCRFLWPILSIIEAKDPEFKDQVYDFLGESPCYSSTGRLVKAKASLQK